MAEELNLNAINPAVKEQISTEQQALLKIEEYSSLVVEKQSLKGELDGCVLFNVLTEEECKGLIEKTEQIKYTFWSPKPRKDFRDADTIECTLQTLADRLWERMKPYVQPSIIIDNNHKYYERELAGEWIASGINPNLLFGRYFEGGHFAPHTGTVIQDLFFLTPRWMYGPGF